MNCPKCEHETHEVKILGCQKCEVCGWHGNPVEAPIGTNNVTLSLAMYQDIKTTLEDAKEILEKWADMSANDSLCYECGKAGRGRNKTCADCDITVTEANSLAVIARLKAVLSE